MSRIESLEREISDLESRQIDKSKIQELLVENAGPTRESYGRGSLDYFTLYPNPLYPFDPDTFLPYPPPTLEPYYSTQARANIREDKEDLLQSAKLDLKNDLPPTPFNSKPSSVEVKDRRKNN